MRIRFPWNAAILLTAGLLAACEQEAPSPEGLCKRASSCEPMDLLVSNESCAAQVAARLGDATAECKECVLGLPCSGMARVASGKVSLTQICPSCPTSVTARASCTAGHQHVLICGIAARPAASASATASAAAAATASPSAVPSAVASAVKPTPAPSLAPLPTVPPLPTAPVPAFP